MATFKLDSVQIAELKSAQRALHDLLADLDTAEKCDIDCQEYRKIQQAAYDRITRLIENYG
jgi:ribosome assembly protein YihI (activator of Der GTPase)